MFVQWATLMVMIAAISVGLWPVVVNRILFIRVFALFDR